MIPLLCASRVEVWQVLLPALSILLIVPTTQGNLRVITGEYGCEQGAAPFDHPHP